MESCTVKPIESTYIMLGCPADFAEAADTLVGMDYHGQIEFGKDLQAKPVWTLNAASSQPPGTSSDVNVIVATVGNVLRFDAAGVKRYDDMAAFTAENDTTEVSS